jgi:hypothetical protein
MRFSATKLLNFSANPAAATPKPKIPLKAAPLITDTLTPSK